MKLFSSPSVNQGCATKACAVHDIYDMKFVKDGHCMVILDRKNHERYVVAIRDKNGMG